MKSPDHVHREIRILTNHIDHLKDTLKKKFDVEVAQIGKECKRTYDALDELKTSQALPDKYKVAIVGRFKTGKSSFVNELLDAKLASEDTNPETAAITTFRHGIKTRATVRFISQEEWRNLHNLYEEDPKHIDAHRVKMWNSFSAPQKSKDGEEEPFDLPALAQEYLKAGGYSLDIEVTADDTKKAEAKFRRQLKEFTSGTKPHHCLVQSIDIELPAPILEGGVLLRKL